MQRSLTNRAISQYQNEKRGHPGGFIRWLSVNRQLVDEGIINLSSERNAYSIAPVNRSDTVVERQFSELLEYANENEMHLKGPAARSLKYFNLSDALDSDVLVDEANQKAVATIFSFWDIRNPDQSTAVLRENWGLHYNFERLKPEDLVSVRKNDETLAGLRSCMREAIEISDDADRREFLDQCFDKLNKGKSSRKEDAAATIGLSGLAFAIDHLLAGLGTIGATALSLANGRTKGRKDAAEASARSILHYLQPASPPKNSAADYVRDLEQWIAEKRGR